MGWGGWSVLAIWDYNRVKDESGLLIIHLFAFSVCAHTSVLGIPTASATISTSHTDAPLELQILVRTLWWASLAYLIGLPHWLAKLTTITGEDMIEAERKHMLMASTSL